MLSCIAMLKHDMSEYAWVRGCTSCEWWAWINLGMWFQWNGWLVDLWLGLTCWL